MSGLIIAAAHPPKKEHFEWIHHVFTQGCWSLWSMNTFMLMGWNSSLLLEEIYADGWFWQAERPRARSLIHFTAAGVESFGDRQAEQPNNPSNESRAEAGHRDHQSTRLAGTRRRRTAEHTTCRSRRDSIVSLGYESQSKSKSLHTLENIRRVPTQVTWLLFLELSLLAIMSQLVFSQHL